MGVNFLKELLKEIRVTKKNEKEIQELIKKRTELEEEPYIRRAQIEGRKSQEEVARIAEYQNKAKAKLDWVLKVARVRAKIGLFLLFLLIPASYALLYLSFEPYQIGEKAHIASAGIVLATCLMMEGLLLSFYKKNWLLFSLSGVALACLLLAHIQLALIRAELLGLLGTSSESFYQKTSGMLTIALPLLALGLELASGLTLFRVIEWRFSPDEVASRTKEREIKNMKRCDMEINRRKNRSEIEAIDFQIIKRYGARKKRLSEEKKWGILLPILIFLLILLSIFASRAHGEEIARNTVILQDLTGSTGPEEFEKNLKAVDTWFCEIGPSEKITVLGISDRSFAKPVVLLQAKTGNKPGYFKEKLKEERENARKEWGRISKGLRPIHKNSDILSAISLAQILLEEESSKKVLVIFSDMRHVTEDLDLESPDKINVEKSLQKVEAMGLIPLLKGIEVFVLGVLTNKKSPRYWSELREFWTGYFRKSGAVLRKYSVSREVR